MIETVPNGRRISAAIDALSEEFGSWRVLVAALGGMLRPRARTATAAHDLPKHLRKDVGLPPIYGKGSAEDYRVLAKTIGMF